MRRLLAYITISTLAACSAPNAGPEPSLAPRAAEAIDPRIPVPGNVPAGPVDAALARNLAQLVGEARAGIGPFDSRLANADRLAGAAGPMASETWVAAEQALSLLIEQYGQTTRVAANIDALGSERLRTQRWITPADQQAIAGAAAEVGAISDRQAADIDRLKDRLAR
jgi:hypothetical protein